jgi:hypothetical protein
MRNESSQHKDSEWRGGYGKQPFLFHGSHPPDGFCRKAEHSVGFAPLRAFECWFLPRPVPSPAVAFLFSSHAVEGSNPDRRPAMAPPGFRISAAFPDIGGKRTEVSVTMSYRDTGVHITCGALCCICLIRSSFSTTRREVRSSSAVNIRILFSSSLISS